MGLLVSILHGSLLRELFKIFPGEKVSFLAEIIPFGTFQPNC